MSGDEEGRKRWRWSAPKGVSSWWRPYSPSSTQTEENVSKGRKKNSSEKVDEEQRIEEAHPQEGRDEKSSPPRECECECVENGFRCVEEKEKEFSNKETREYDDKSAENEAVLEEEMEGGDDGERRVSKTTREEMTNEAKDAAEREVPYGGTNTVASADAAIFRVKGKVEDDKGEKETAKEEKELEEEEKGKIALRCETTKEAIEKRYQQESDVLGESKEDSESECKGDTLKRKLEELLKPLDFASDVYLGEENAEDEVEEVPVEMGEEDEEMAGGGAKEDEAKGLAEDDRMSSKVSSPCFEKGEEYCGSYSVSSMPLSDYECVEMVKEGAGERVKVPARRLMRRAWCAVRGFGAKAKRLGKQLQEEAVEAVSQARMAGKEEERHKQREGLEEESAREEEEQPVIRIASPSEADGGLRVMVLGEEVTRRLRNAKARRPRVHVDRPRSSVVHFRRSRYFHQGQSSFEELRRFIKQGSDFCKDLSAILQERSEAEAQYAKSLSKLSGKLVKASKEALGSVSHAWQLVGAEMEAESEIHRALSVALSDEVSKPLRTLLESHHRTRKQVEAVVEKAGKSLTEWRAAEAKTKKQSFLCARENERLQDASVLVEARLGRATRASSASSTGAEKSSVGASASNGSLNNHLSEKELAKLESKRRKAEEAVRKADVEYYTFSIRSERARLEWETAVNKGSQCFQTIEEERLQNLKELATRYLSHLQEVGPKRVQSCDRLTEPILHGCDISRDMGAVSAIRGTGQPLPEQLLPDFYAEHITLAMNRERRRQNLVKLLQLIRSDIDRERRGKQGVENLARALQQTPTFGTQDSQQNVTEKLHHMCSMLTYLEAARYKIQSALAELDGRQRPPHPLAPHITVTRDRQGLQQSVLKVPSWVWQQGVLPLEQLTAGDSPDWADRGKADGNSMQPDSDFDEFSSQGSDKEYHSSLAYSTITENVDNPAPSVGRCRALYDYSPNLYDELKLRPGDVINIHDKQADGWWLGELNGTIGIFPATYVEEIK